MSAGKIEVQGMTIAMKRIREEDYLSLTDMAKQYSERPDLSIGNWLQTNNTLRFIALWEKINNPNFKPLVFQGFKELMQENGRYISPQRLADEAGVAGLQARRGRYGGTYAHVDIAFEFATWLSPEFKLYLIQEFKRLKLDEAKQLDQDWDATRFISKVTYTIHQQAVKDYIAKKLQGMGEADKKSIYASEANILNMAVFGMTARQWRETNPEQAKRGNIRDYANIFDLVVLSVLQGENASYIREGLDPDIRLELLVASARYQFQAIAHDDRLKLIDGGEKE